jgi:DNA-binding CsgD family transcriptional regulator
MRSCSVNLRSTDRVTNKLYINKRQRNGISISELFKLPVNIYWKNNDGYYLGCNDTKAEVANFNSRNDIIGTKIYDYVRKENAVLVEKTDQKVINSSNPQYKIECADFIRPSRSLLDPMLYNYVSIKQPLYASSGNIIGLFGLSISFNILPYINWCMFVELLSKDKLNNIGQTICNYIYKQVAEIASLSYRENQCLFYVSRGRSFKEIANIVKISQKTVEYYWENVKMKTNCNLKSEIIDKYLMFKLFNE